MNYTCDDCTDHDGKPQSLLIYRGGKAPWIKTQVYFCPLCGQIFIEHQNSQKVTAITIDEYEPTNVN